MPINHSIKHILPTSDYLRACFNYNPETGGLYWKHRPLEHFTHKKTWVLWNSKNAGQIAGTVGEGTKGYCYVRLNFQNNERTREARYRAHRLIWKLMTDKDPPLTIDHKDRNGLNNRWDNLRLATPSQQIYNTGLRKNNTSGYSGVSREGTKWRAKISLGTFNTAKEAAAAYEAAARTLHGKFYRTI